MDAIWRSARKDVASDHLLRYLEIAQKLGAGLIRTILTTHLLVWLTRHASIAAVADQFEAAQVYLGLENYESASFHDFYDVCYSD